MLEDTQIVYQALLAKLFINEKIELGGITRSNLDVIEGEYQYISLTTNEKEKFLISSDFFRRLGDIMFYKNGLIGFNYERSDGNKGESNKDFKEALVDSLYYWAFNLKTELQDFCGEKHCYEFFPELYKYCKRVDEFFMKRLQQIGNDSKNTTLDIDAQIQVLCELFWGNEKKNAEKSITTTNSKCKDWTVKPEIKKYFKEFWTEDTRRKRLNRLPFDQIEDCNKKRKSLWEKNRTLPCYACKYYNRSLRITLHNLFGIDTEGVNYGKKSESKTINILRQIVMGGSAKSMRQNYMIQLAEVLDCLGNTTLSCSVLKNDRITKEFLSKFLHDVHVVNDKLDKPKREGDFMLLRYPIPIEKLTKLETCILYYWEASVCFRYGKEMKKAAGSMKKILRVIQNYLRVLVKVEEHDKAIEAKVVIGEFLNEIKNRIVKQSLLCLFSHYNYINMVEIQRLKWVFYTQMYENISMSRLTLFPDVEEIMLIYYELIKLCIIDEKDLSKTTDSLADTRKYIGAYSRDHLGTISYTWDTIDERNKDFNDRLIGIYNNLSMTSLRHENTKYERILSLRMKALLNQHILGLMIPELKDGQSFVDNNPVILAIFAKFLTNEHSEAISGETEWKKFFPDVIFSKTDDPTQQLLSDRIKTLEFLIKDSMYCLTEILETLSPYTSTTLFTHSFIGGIYQTLNQWNYLFNALFHYYRYFDLASPLPTLAEDDSVELEHHFALYDYDTMDVCQHPCGADCSKYSNAEFAKYGTGIKPTLAWQSECPRYRALCGIKSNRFEKDKAVLDSLFTPKEIAELSGIYRKVLKCHNISDRFFDNVLQTITKPNIQYTLTNYSGELAVKSYRNAIGVHREGRAYKEMISRMFYLDDDLKNDTIQFDLAIERFKINSDYIDKSIERVMCKLSDSLYDIENFCMDNETRTTLGRRFPNLFWNVSSKE